MPVAKIVVVDDEADMVLCMVHQLRSRGHTVTGLTSALAGLEAIRREAPDVALLDRMMPELDGDEICRRVKQDPLTRDTRIVMVSALDRETDLATGMALGADDYVRKPFSLVELSARVEAVLRRGAERNDGEARRTAAGPLLLDLDHGMATLDGRALELTPTELCVLSLFVSRPGRLLTRGQILDLALAAGADLIERNVDVHVAALRTHLGDHRDLIETVRGFGYRLRTS